MEREDQLIKDLLNEGFLTKAPENFTDRVMQAVAESAAESAAGREYPVSVYFAIIVGTLAALSGILYFTNEAFLVKYSGYFTGVLGGMLPFLSSILSDFTSLNFSLPYNGLLLGIGAIVLLLLAFDMILFRRKRFIGIFSF